ncbi:MAG TPA: 30S ribosomal protein S6 [Smithellaceae bacterium]|nr:30S ribosomal protein S6 [Smithellaceae bacterium]HRS88979.1 30S ribosomal protein S6 [Smithellaceae bacterium]HRV25595.1 30S ribosomal protein S6 [Smithellaceae bacterium]
MKRYEVIAIVKPDLSEDDISKIIERIENIIVKRNGIIAKIDKWGKRRLAYEINKQKEGYYFLFDFVGDGPIVAEIERNYKIDDRVLKFISIKKDGALTREGIDAEIAAAEAKKTQPVTENETSSAEDKTIQPADRTSEEKPRRSTIRKPAKKDEDKAEE